MATVAPSGMSATACSGEATILFMTVFTSREWWSSSLSSRQRERHDVIAHLRPQSSVTAGGDHDELFAAPRAVRHGCRLRARRKLTAPEHCPGFDVEGAQRRVTRRADEDQSAPGRE